MSDQEQWTAGTTASDAKLGHDEPDGEHRQRTDPPVAAGDDEPAAGDDRNP